MTIKIVSKDEGVLTDLEADLLGPRSPRRRGSSPTKKSRHAPDWTHAFAGDTAERAREWGMERDQNCRRDFRDPEQSQRVSARDWGIALPRTDRPMGRRILPAMNALWQIILQIL